MRTNTFYKWNFLVLVSNSRFTSDIMVNTFNILLEMVFSATQSILQIILSLFSIIAIYWALHFSISNSNNIKGTTLCHDVTILSYHLSMLTHETSIDNAKRWIIKVQLYSHKCLLIFNITVSEHLPFSILIALILQLKCSIIKHFP